MLARHILRVRYGLVTPFGNGKQTVRRAPYQPNTGKAEAPRYGSSKQPAAIAKIDIAVIQFAMCHLGR